MTDPGEQNWWKDDSWTEEDIADLVRRICEEMRILFGHPPEASAAMLEQYRVEYPVSEPHNWFAIYEHESPFGMALRIHYAIFLKRDPHSVDFLDWRKQFN